MPWVLVKSERATPVFRSDARSRPVSPNALATRGGSHTRASGCYGSLNILFAPADWKIMSCPGTTAGLELGLVLPL
jgi:hypothetical protein